MGLDDNYHHRQLDDDALQIETPLIAPLNSHIRQHFKTALYPYNASLAVHTTHYDEDVNSNGINSFTGSASEHKCRYPNTAKVKKLAMSDL